MFCCANVIKHDNATDISHILCTFDKNASNLHYSNARESGIIDFIVPKSPYYIDIDTIIFEKGYIKITL